jgi:hypothetical protein
MWFKTIVIIFLCTSIASAQTVPVVKDSTQLYAKIENFSKGSKFKTFSYKLFFKPMPSTSVSKKKKKKKTVQKPYSSFEGKIIRHINIITLDPFGNSIADTITVPLNKVSKAGNILHVKTHNFTIRNLLLIHQNKPFDSLLVIESERLVRNQNYVRDVSFYTVATSKKSDSVDIYIRELDNWSIAPRVEGSTKYITLNVTDNNFGGMGHQYSNEITRYDFSSEGAYNTNYFIPNIYNTYINTRFHYGTDRFQNFSKIVDVERPFFSSYTKWAGGINFTQLYNKDSLQFPDSVFVPRRYKYNSQDYWLGYAIPLFKGNTLKNRSTNLITTARFLRVKYLETPDERVDPQHNLSNETFYLAGIGVSTRKYVHDLYIFKYGITEDVPVGILYGITGGYQLKNNQNRLYLGVRYSCGNYYRWGYFSTNMECGTFLHARQTEQGIITGGINYFTKLEEIGRWKFRQFIKPQLTIGLNRFKFDSLTINEGYGLDGFTSTGLVGTNRFILTLQTQSYAPWNFIGFRFGPFINYSMGMLGNAQNGFSGSKIYSQFGIGILIKNENLIINTFQISLSFYPVMPGVGNELFKLNAFKTSDFGFTDFELGKPEAVLYQ